MTEAEILELNIANAALGIATIVCIAAVGWGVVSELWARARQRWALRAETHAFVMPEIGLTMADGGERMADDEDEG